MNAELEHLTRRGFKIHLGFKDGQFILTCGDNVVTCHDFHTACISMWEKYQPLKNYQTLQGFKGEIVKSIANYTAEENDGFVIYFESGRKIYVTADMGQGIGYVRIGIDQLP